MTPYYALRNAVNHCGKVCTPWQVRRELANYLGQFRVVAKTPEGRVIDWNDLHTRESWFASKKKRSRRKKDGSVVYRAEVEELTVHRDPLIQEMVSGWAAEVDAFVAQQQEEADGNQYSENFDENAVPRYHWTGKGMAKRDEGWYVDSRDYDKLLALYRALQPQMTLAEKYGTVEIK